MMRMSNLDILSRDFWKDNRRFADLFNTVLYEGKQVILPEKLMEADSNLSGSIQTKKKEDVFVERRADLIRKFAGDSEYAIFLLENQSHIHYGMPLRVMMYDALGYREECAKKKRENKKNAVYANRDEFLSGMRKEERIHPVFTLVVYYGEKPWDGPRRLKDMMVDMPKWMEKSFSDYSMNLLEIRSSEHAFQNEDVSRLVYMIQHIYRKQIEEMKKECADVYVKKDVIKLAGVITENEEIIKYAEEHKEEEALNMCEATKQWEEKIRNDVINMMGVRKEGEENLAPEEAIERLKTEGEAKGKAKGILEGRENEKIEIAEKMKAEGFDNALIEKLTGILLH